MSFIENIKNRISIDQYEIEQVISHFTVIDLSKKNILLKKGQNCEKYYFLESGLLRFSLNNESEDKTAWIVFEGNFFTDIFSIEDSQTTQFDIVAIERSKIYSISKTELEKLLLIVPKFEKYLRITWEYNFRNISEIKLLQQFGDAKMRYEFFLRNEKWMQRVPQKYLASFIGITPFSLSRIRRTS